MRPDRAHQRGIFQAACLDLLRPSSAVGYVSGQGEMMESPQFALVRLLQVVSGDAGIRLRAERIIARYLEQRWTMPRRFERIGEASFLLIDPRQADGDLSEIELLREALQAHLFGGTDAGTIEFLRFSGSEPQVRALGAMPEAAIVDGMKYGTLKGIFPGIAVIGAPRVNGSGGDELARDLPSQRHGFGFRFSCLYNAPKGLIAGNAICCVNSSARSRVTTHLELSRRLNKGEEYYDLLNLEHALAVMGTTVQRGLMAVPIAYGTLTRERSCSLYLSHLARFTPAQLRRLCITIYDTPLQPNFGLLTAGLDAIEVGGVGTSDLQVVNAETPFRAPFFRRLFSVTLVLEGKSVAADIHAVAAWKLRAEDFRDLRAVQSIGNVATRLVLDYCIRSQAVLLSGPAISASLPDPVEPVACLPQVLPLLPAKPSGGPALHQAA